MSPSPSARLLYSNACYNSQMGELTKNKNENPSSDISRVTDGLNALDAVKAAAKAIGSESPEIMTGVLAAVLPSSLPLVRLVHASAKGNFLKQLMVEAEVLRGQGAINEEFLKTDEAHACFSDLLDAIDKMSPDPKRYDAIRTAFLKMMGHGQTGKSGVYAQQLLRAIYDLSAGEIAVLATIYHMGNGTNDRADSWLNDVANSSGILRSEVVEGIEETLIAKRLILPRVDQPKTYPRGTDRISYGLKNRLTTFGQEVCENFMRQQS